MKTVYDALDPIVSASISEKEKGTKYEAACVWYLENDPFWASYFERVGTLEQALAWDGCPIHDTQDTGIDLVAQSREDGSWWAIQCKCHDSEKQLPKGVCDSFFARALGDPAISRYMIMTAAKGLARNLQQQVDNTGTMVVDTAKMAASALDWAPFIEGRAAERVTYDARPHQREAIDAIEAAFAEHNRCKAIMACGTGKTLMALRLAEEYLGGRGTVLFCAPSISLVGQSMREWLAQSRVPLAPLVVCSDAKASRAEDAIPMTLDSFEYPATTRPDRLFAAWEASHDNGGLTVVFSTYQSIDVIHAAQEMGLPDFDLIVCDEAHRTTGSALPGVDETEASAFMKVHYDRNVRGAKRLYMTATPRIYGETAKRKGAEEDFTIASMDDESIYGPVAYQIKFGEAVERGLLTDYKVVVLTVEEDALRGRMPLTDDEGVDASSLDADDIGKIIGCWKGLAEHGENAPVDALGIGDMLVVDDMNAEPAYEVQPLHRAVGFCSTINASKTICEAFSRIVERYVDEGGDDFDLRCELDHVDGAMNSADRNRKLAWLGGEVPQDECRILTNARCLAEGIDVPTLDAVIFFNAKNSTVDVVQAVGRVMRRAEGKHFGYIILPIFVPSGMTPEQALDDSKVFANVWSILQALRSHDERIEARVNALALEQQAQRSRGADPDAARHKGWDDSLPTKREQEERAAAEIAAGVQMKLSLFPVERWERAVHTTLVRKCGTRIYWDTWAADVARIAERHIERIGALVRDDEKVRERFQIFLEGLRDSLNPGISEQDAVEMIAQHMITVPVFDALFGDFEFAKSNPVSIAIDDFIATLAGRGIEEASDADTLETVYASVRRRAAMVRTDTARQQLIRDLYEQFFKVAFEKTSQKMGVVYTPTEIIDYILRETDRVLRREFGKSLADEGVHILDPFAGTGSFMAHLIESDLIPDDRLERKYRHEMHSNEILLLAYYIMTINIEYAYHERMGGEYVPFEGGVLTDTFQMTEAEDTLDERVFAENSERVRRQNRLPIRVIVGNPPYSVGQKSANDNNQNESYPSLDARIAETYAARTDATNKNSLYDSYVRAFRWASDRIGDQGVVCFVSNAGWLRGQAMSGMRRCLADEFDDVYVFDLRGNARTQGEERRRERDNVFGQGTRTPISVTLLIRHAGEKHPGRIHYHDVGDYLLREDKLGIVRDSAASGEVDWAELAPDKYGDWLDQRDDSFYEFAPMGIENKVTNHPSGLFVGYSRGFETDRDAWVYGFSSAQLQMKMSGTIAFYNHERTRYAESNGEALPKDFVSRDSSKIAWSRTLLSKLGRNQKMAYAGRLVRAGMYRPYCKQYVYASNDFADYPGQQLRFFPDAGDRKKHNREIVISLGRNSYPLMVDCLPDIQLQFNGQCFPLYWYEEREVGTALFDANDYTGAGGQTSLFGDGASRKELVYDRHDAITDEALSVFREAYPHAFMGRYKKDGGIELNKEDIFYYVYGVLHSPEYRTRFASNLKKELPRIPLAEDFAAFSRAGRALAELHLNYEVVEPWAEIEEDGDAANPGRTVKMKFGKCKKTEDNPKGVDHTVLHVSEGMTLRNIPERAYAYAVNGRSAIEWLMDRYQVRTDKASGIVNDPNDYSDDPRYIVDLVKRVVTVSMETMEIIHMLPPLREKEQPASWPIAWKA
ncbi:DEAD/DEAH box helicase [Collinsella intestinalis]|uniref:DEAD/DEAH box helicase n=1 Tax=Collinsella intestinalis TaxID=147207 RepID=UPI0019570258|nr:type ISP restriction/modification enzyme [Collinsella intestinalis]MBM6942627.1 DEAD/DEAH box helicase [Collinsella intestinalis]